MAVVYSPVCVGPGQKLQRHLFSQHGSFLRTQLSKIHIGILVFSLSIYIYIYIYIYLYIYIYIYIYLYIYMYSACKFEQEKI